MSSESVARDDWATVVASFRRFFEPLGEVVESPDEIEFIADITGLAVRRDGTSKSFMPLHDLEAGWETIVFEHEAGEVRLIGAGATYTYRVPSNLRP